MKRNTWQSCALILTMTFPLAADEPKESPAVASPTKATFLITGLHCPPCTKTLEGSLKTQPGIRSVQVDWKTKNARIEFDEALVPAQRVSQLIGSTPHMMGARMQYGGWLAIRVPAITDEASAAPIKATLQKVAGVKSVAAYPAQHAVGIQFAPDGKVRSEDLLKVLHDAEIEATNY